MFGWALLCFALWNIATIWWIWFATPIGPPAATLASSFLNMIAFMLFHTVSKHAHKALAYTIFIAGWIATEYWYTVGDFSWPWLILGNGFSHDVWAVQWYEYTGVFGGSLWVLLCNILFFEALIKQTFKKWFWASFFLVFPLALSLVMWATYHEEEQRSVKVSIIQPNVDCYDKFHGDRFAQQTNILQLLAHVPQDAQFILLPETAIPGHYWEPSLSKYPEDNHRDGFFTILSDSILLNHPQAMLISGANTMRFYPHSKATPTARQTPYGEGWYDYYNAAVGIDSSEEVQIHHKGRLVIGVEKTPTWIFDVMDFLVVDLGGILGQIGQGEHGTVFTHKGVKTGPAICYEGLYGDFYGDFVRRGAEFMSILSNDGWWKDTPGYRHLFTISRLRAIEHRRAIARSANTGRSGFISARGDVGETLGWEQRGVITAQVPLSTHQTFYTIYGDYIGRLAEYLFLLCILYYVAYRVKKKNYLVS